MKTLIEYIKESLEDKQLDNLLVFYNINEGEDIVIEAPETFSEDDLTGYLGDLWFNEFPGGKDNKLSHRLFGNNQNKIIDVHLEYSSFAHDKVDDDKEPDVKWDNNYEVKNSDEVELNYFTISELKYVIQFETFNLKCDTSTSMEDDLMKIFESTQSSKLNEYPVTLMLDEEKPFEYDEEI